MPLCSPVPHAARPPLAARDLPRFYNPAAQASGGPCANNTSPAAGRALLRARAPLRPARALPSAAAMPTTSRAAVPLLVAQHSSPLAVRTMQVAMLRMAAVAILLSVVCALALSV
jgi:hypothetical protein